MFRSTAGRAVGLALVSVALTATPALASGGSGGGGGGGGGGTTTDPTTATSGNLCISLGGVDGTTGQSIVTADAWLQTTYSVSRCGGNNPSFTITTTADDAAGNRVLSATDTWVPGSKNQSFGMTHETDSAAFGTTYKVTVTVIVPETGTVAATQSKLVSTPAARIPSCATVSNLGGTAGYYPNMTTSGALWLSYTMKNCGGRDWFDTDFKVTDLDTGQVVFDYALSPQLTVTNTSGLGLVDVEPVATSHHFEVRVEVRHHGDSALLDSRSISLLTPDAK